jgi:uroporphyrinogen-III synthase
VTAHILILRPQPGADATARRAAGLGLTAIVAPLFRIDPVQWNAPAAEGFDGILLTSANAARYGGNGLKGFARLPCYAVGESTAEAARAAGFADIRVGRSDGQSLLGQIARDGRSHILHPCGYDHIELEHSSIGIERPIVYSAAPLNLSRAAVTAAVSGALILIHSPRAARRFGDLAGASALPKNDMRLVAISEAAAAAAGPGWGEIHVADAPRDAAMLALAAHLGKPGGARYDCSE